MQQPGNEKSGRIGKVVWFHNGQIIRAVFIEMLNNSGKIFRIASCRYAVRLTYAQLQSLFPFKEKGNNFLRDREMLKTLSTSNNPSPTFVPIWFPVLPVSRD